MFNKFTKVLAISTALIACTSVSQARDLPNCGCLQIMEKDISTPRCSYAPHISNKTQCHYICQQVAQKGDYELLKSYFEPDSPDPNVVVNCTKAQKCIGTCNNDSCIDNCYQN